MNISNDPSAATTMEAIAKDQPVRRRSSRRKKQPSDYGRTLCEGDNTETSETRNQDDDSSPVSVREVVQAPPAAVAYPEEMPRHDQSTTKQPDPISGPEQRHKTRTEVLADMGIQRISTMPIWFAFETQDLEIKKGQNQDIAAKAQQSMRHVLTGRFQNQVPTADTVIHINLLQCSKGDRTTRVWCGEVGLGWIVIEVEWNMTKGKKSITSKPIRIKHYHSAGRGSYDLCDRKYGERTLLHNLCVKAATEIKNDVTHLLLQTERF